MDAPELCSPGGSLSSANSAKGTASQIAFARTSLGREATPAVRTGRAFDRSNDLQNASSIPRCDRALRCQCATWGVPPLNRRAASLCE